MEAEQIDYVESDVVVIPVRHLVIDFHEVLHDPERSVLLAFLQRHPIAGSQLADGHLQLLLYLVRGYFPVDQQVLLAQCLPVEFSNPYDSPKLLRDNFAVEGLQVECSFLPLPHQGKGSGFFEDVDEVAVLPGIGGVESIDLLSHPFVALLFQ
jgi:hypothetical protein